MDPFTFYCPTKNHSQYRGYALEEVLTPQTLPLMPHVKRNQMRNH